MYTNLLNKYIEQDGTNNAVVHTFSQADCDCVDWICCCDCCSEKCNDCEDACCFNNCCEICTNCYSGEYCCECFENCKDNCTCCQKTEMACEFMVKYCPVCWVVIGAAGILGCCCGKCDPDRPENIRREICCLDCQICCLKNCSN